MHSLSTSVDESSAPSLISPIWPPAGAFEGLKEDGPIAIFVTYLMCPAYITSLLALGEAGPPLQIVFLPFGPQHPLLPVPSSVQQC